MYQHNMESDLAVLLFQALASTKLNNFQYPNTSKAQLRDRFKQLTEVFSLANLHQLVKSNASSAHGNFSKCFDGMILFSDNCNVHSHSQKSVGLKI